MSTPLLQINTMTKNYKSKTIFFENIIIKDRVTLLLGKNGSGKSTLLKAICTVIRSTSDIINTNTISYMPEKMVLPNINSMKYLELSTKNRKTLHKYIDLFNMKEHIHKDIFELSKGMRMKLRLIIALTNDKDIYILDEPFNGLDKESLYKLIDVINKSKKNFLISTHLDLSKQFTECDVIKV